MQCNVINISIQCPVCLYFITRRGNRKRTLRFVERFALKKHTKKTCYSFCLSVIWLNMCMPTHILFSNVMADVPFTRICVQSFRPSYIYRGFKLAIAHVPVSFTPDIIWLYGRDGETLCNLSYQPAGVTFITFVVQRHI